MLSFCVCEEEWALLVRVMRHEGLFPSLARWIFVIFIIFIGNFFFGMFPLCAGIAHLQSMQRGGFYKNSMGRAEAAQFTIQILILFSQR